VSLKAGGQLFAELSQREQYFLIGRALAFTRPELALARVLPADRLEAIFQAAVLAGVPSFQTTADPKAIEAEYKLIEKFEPQHRTTLARLSREYARQATETDVRDFVEGAELTANRVGALLCTDLEVVKDVLQKDSAATVPLRARSRDLMLYCLSKDYAELRASLGLKLEIKPPGGGK